MARVKEKLFKAEFVDGMTFYANAATNNLLIVKNTHSVFCGDSITKTDWDIIVPFWTNAYPHP